MRLVSLRQVKGEAHLSRPRNTDIGGSHPQRSPNPHGANGGGSGRLNGCRPQDPRSEYNTSSPGGVAAAGKVGCGVLPGVLRPSTSTTRPDLRMAERVANVTWSLSSPEKLRQITRFCQCVRLMRRSSTSAITAAVVATLY